MRVPKYILKKIQLRAKHALAWTEYDCDVAAWLRKHDIEVETEDISGGVEGIVHPIESGRRIIQAIEKKQEA